jgi:hypothetical protein
MKGVNIFFSSKLIKKKKEMRKLVEKQLQAKPSDVINVTEQFFPELLDIETLIQEAKNAEQIHPYTKKAFGGWKSIPLRSAGGKIGVDGSSAMQPDSPTLTLCNHTFVNLSISLLEMMRNYSRLD